MGVGVMMVNQMLLRVLWLFLGFDELIFFLLLNAMLLADAAAAAVEDAKSTSTT